MRGIQDAKTMAVQVKADFENELGRSASEEELAEFVDAFTGYAKYSNKTQIAMAYRSWQGDDGEILDPGELERVGDPRSQVLYDIQEDFGNEIKYNERRESNEQTNRRLMNATRGAALETPAGVRSTQVRR